MPLLPRAALRLHGVIHVQVLRTFFYILFANSFMPPSDISHTRCSHCHFSPVWCNLWGLAMTNRVFVICYASETDTLIDFIGMSDFLYWGILSDTKNNSTSDLYLETWFPLHLPQLAAVVLLQSHNRRVTNCRIHLWGTTAFFLFFGLVCLKFKALYIFVCSWLGRATFRKARLSLFSTQLAFFSHKQSLKTQKIRQA